uniref:Uncharacterized protein n=1 Tax=Rhizochromulina marina TaxID=1034831 RepID=A0A7S2RW91_9STRA|mmetsp:Transcript_21858/g.63605  ORF Transcript_21858/g.63605 Transcript_21858/m.63605 type:complete len:169 (+) Transcript_21858:145-651(+)
MDLSGLQSVLSWFGQAGSQWLDQRVTERKLAPEDAELVKQLLKNDARAEGIQFSADDEMISISSPHSAEGSAESGESSLLPGAKTSPYFFAAAAVCCALVYVYMNGSPLAKRHQAVGLRVLVAVLAIAALALQPAQHVLNSGILSVAGVIAVVVLMPPRRRKQQRFER